mgnify:FL=1
MANAVIDKKDEIVMKLIHYFVTNENYKPVIVNGVQNEVWLENLDNEVPLIRININYIHNEEQLLLDEKKADIIRKTIKKKTYSIKMNLLNILVNTRSEVNTIENNNIESIIVNKITDLKKNEFMKIHFPEFSEKINFKKSDAINLFEMTEELNNKTKNDDKQLAKIFLNKDKPIVTTILIFINIVMFLISLLDYSGVINLFANYYVNVKNGEVYRLLTSAFVHANVVHIFFNMYALFELGPQIERFYGRKRYLLIYLGSAFMGSLFSVVLTNNVSVGASTSIFGLFGAMIYFGYKYRNTLDNFLRSGIIPVLLINLILGFIIPNIDISGHIGGLLGGLIISYLVGVPNKENKKDKFNGIIIYIILTLALFAMLMQK